MQAMQIPLFHQKPCQEAFCLNHVESRVEDDVKNLMEKHGKKLMQNHLENQGKKHMDNHVGNYAKNSMRSHLKNHVKNQPAGEWSWWVPQGHSSASGWVWTLDIYVYTDRVCGLLWFYLGAPQAEILPKLQLTKVTAAPVRPKHTRQAVTPPSRVSISVKKLLWQCWFDDLREQTWAFLQSWG